jgi:RimJ/RimL family protein N-acetyltransferase
MKEGFDLSKVKIRKAKPEDAKGVAGIFKVGFSTNNFSMTGSNKPWSKKKIEKVKEKYSRQGQGEYYFVADYKNIIIGTMAYSGYTKGRTKHSVTLGWMVHPDFQKKGVASKMLNYIITFAQKKKIKRLEAEVATLNKASISLIKKFKFNIEGIKKKALILDNGRYIDTLIVGRLLK